MLASAPTVLDQADRMATGLEGKPFPYFLALVLVALGVLWGALCAALWLIARGHRKALEREVEISKGLALELAQVRREHLQDLVKLAMVTEGVVRLRDELEAKKAKRSAP